MYGTVARIRVKPGAESQLREQMEQYNAVKVPGFVTTYVYRTDANPNEYYMAVIFDSKDAYWANANSPEQDARYREMMTSLDAEPEWHDGEIIAGG